LVSVTPLTRTHLLELVHAPVDVSIETVSEPLPPDAVVYPAVPFTSCGCVKPEGTWTRTEPLLIPPAAAVYVNVKVLPVEEAATFVGETVFVPVPSAA